MRTAALEELILAVRVLIDGQHFTTGVASALCAHMRQTLHPGTERLPNMDIYLEHAQFLPLPAIRELLDFLWMQIGLRFHSLPLVENVRQRLLQVSIKLSPVHLLLPLHCYKRFCNLARLHARMRLQTGVDTCVLLAV